jgi:hypothetical protein
MSRRTACERRGGVEARDRRPRVATLPALERAKMSVDQEKMKLITALNETLARGLKMWKAFLFVPDLQNWKLHIWRRGTVQERPLLFIYYFKKV